MAIKGYGVHFQLLYEGSPYGATGSSTVWTMNDNATLYQYVPTIDGSGTITVGTPAVNTSNATPSIVNDAYGQAYFEAIPAGRYTILFENLTDPSKWMFFPGYIDVQVGWLETVEIKITGDGTAGPFDLTIPGGDGINTTCKPFQGNIDVYYMGRTRLRPTTDYTLTSSTVHPFALDTVEIVNTGRGRGDATILRTTEHLVVKVGYLPGGGY